MVPSKRIDCAIYAVDAVPLQGYANITVKNALFLPFRILDYLSQNVPLPGAFNYELELLSNGPMMDISFTSVGCVIVSKRAKDFILSVDDNLTALSLELDGSNSNMFLVDGIRAIDSITRYNPDGEDVLDVVNKMHMLRFSSNDISGRPWFRWRASANSIYIEEDFFEELINRGFVIKKPFDSVNYRYSAQDDQDGKKF